MENKLDEIAGGRMSRVEYLSEYYLGEEGLKASVEKKTRAINRFEAKRARLPGLEVIFFFPIFFLFLNFSARFFFFMKFFLSLSFCFHFFVLSVCCFVLFCFSRRKEKSLFFRINH